MIAALIALDLLLVLGLTLRLTRLVITDDLGQWWIQDPVRDWVIRHADPVGDFNDYGWRGKLQSGLDCPFCVGFWIGAGALASLALVGGPGEAHDVWRYIAGAFALNWVAAHLGSRLGDAGYEDEVESDIDNEEQTDG